MDHWMIASDFEHRCAAEHSFKTEFFLWKFKLFEARGNELYKYVVIDFCYEIDNIETLHFAFDHQNVLF